MKETERIPSHPSELCLTQMHFLNVVSSDLFELLVFLVQQYIVYILLLNLADAIQSERSFIFLMKKCILDAAIIIIRSRPANNQNFLWGIFVCVGG